MKKLFHTLIVLLCICQISTAKDIANQELLTFFKINTDATDDGVHGIEIKYNVNYKYIKNEVGNNLQYKKSKKIVEIFFIENDTAINSVFNKVNFENTGTNEMFESKYTNNISYTDFFLPYAALNISEGEHVITIGVRVSVFDTNAVNTHILEEIDEQSVFKKKQLNFSLIFDDITIRETDLKGEAWDFSIPFLSGTRPDIKASILLANCNIWKYTQSDRFTYSVGNTRSPIKFPISEGDKIKINIFDEDILFDDYVGSFTIKPTANDTIENNTINNLKGLIKTCKVTWKVE